MARWSAIFNARAFLSAGVSLATTRAYATVGGAGEAVSVNEPVFGRERVYASPPRSSDVISLDATGTFQRQACGKWSDGSPVILHQRDTGGGAVRSMNIHVNPTITANALASNPARSVNIVCDNVITTLNPNFGGVGRKNAQTDVLRGAGVAQGEDADWVYQPVAYQVAPGCPMVVCSAFNWTGSSYQQSAIAVCMWDDTLTGSNKWKLHYRGPTVQVTQARGAPWQFPQMFSLGNPNELWATFVDYRTNPGSVGGQAFIFRLTRSAPGQPFVPGEVLPLLQNNEGRDNTHFHCVGLVRFGANGMAAIVVQGDSNNARTYVMVRDDMNYLQGSDGSFVASTLQNPTQDEINVGRGWRLYQNAGGSPLATTGANTFSGGTWDNTAKTLSATGLNISTVGNRVSFWVVINSGTGITTPIYDRVTVHSGTTVTLPNLNVAGSPTNWSGFVCANQPCHQPVAVHQLANGQLYFGCDESVPSGTIAEIPSFAVGDRVIRWRGVGDSTTAHTPSQEWNQFQAVCDLDRRDRFYVGKYESSSFDSDASGRIMVSDGGRQFATIAAPNANLMPALGLHGVFAPASGDRFLVYTTSTSTFAVREPKYVQQSRPLLTASQAFTQHAISTLGTSVVAGADGSPLAAWSSLVDRANLATFFPGHAVPPPPSNGPIIRIQNRGQFGFNRGITGATLANNARIRVSGWFYGLPQTSPNTSDGSQGYNSASIVPFFNFYPVGQNSFTRRSSDISFQRIDGYGWQPFTISLGRPTTEWIGSDAANITGPFSLGMMVRTESGNRWQLWEGLFCIDSVVQGDSGEIPVVPPPVSASSASIAEASSRLNVPLSGTAWTCVMRGSIPRNGGDEYMPNRNASRALFTLSNGTTYLRVTADPTGNQISVTDGTNTVSCAAPAGQVLHFDRGGQLTIGLALTGTTLTLAVSVDGTTINSASGTVIGTTYDRVLSGDQNNTNAEPMEWWSLDSRATALNAAEMGDIMRDAPLAFGTRSPGGIAIGTKIGIT